MKDRYSRKKPNGPVDGYFVSGTPILRYERQKPLFTIIRLEGCRSQKRIVSPSTAYDIKINPED